MTKFEGISLPRNFLKNEYLKNDSRVAATQQWRFIWGSRAWSKNKRKRQEIR